MGWNVKSPSTFEKFWPDDRGNVALLFAIALGLVLIAGGVGLDMLRLAKERTAMHEAADSAALIAAKLYRAPEAEKLKIANATFLQNYGKRPGESKPDIKIAFEADRATVVATRAVPTTLLAITGTKSMRTSVTSVAARGVSSPVCILALDTSLPNGIEIYGNASLIANGCAAASNSGDDQGIRTYGAATAKAAEFGVVGDFDGKFSPVPETGITPLADPYKDIRLPPAEPCIDVSDRLKRTSFVLRPGTYCGGVEINSGADVILEPGLYVMMDGRFEVQSGAVVKGDEVTIAFTGKASTLHLQGGASLTLTAPKSGAFNSIVLFSESNSPHVEWATISGGATLTYDGALYLPTHELWVKSPATDQATLKAMTNGYGVIAKRVWVQGNAAVDVTLEDPDPNVQTLRFRYGSRLIR
jgi:Flp pilus assembly protein TadG